MAHRAGAGEKSTGVGLLLKDDPFDGRCPAGERVFAPAGDDAVGWVDTEGESGNISAGGLQFAAFFEDHGIGQRRGQATAAQDHGKIGGAEDRGFARGVGEGRASHRKQIRKRCGGAGAKPSRRPGETIRGSGAEINPSHQRTEPAVKRNIKRPLAGGRDARGRGRCAGIVRQHGLKRDQAVEADADSAVAIPAGRSASALGVTEEKGVFSPLRAGVGAAVNGAIGLQWGRPISAGNLPRDALAAVRQT